MAGHRYLRFKPALAAIAIALSPTANALAQTASGDQTLPEVKVQGETAACRDVLNMLFPNGEVERIIAPSIGVGKPIHGRCGLAVL